MRVRRAPQAYRQEDDRGQERADRPVRKYLLRDNTKGPEATVAESYTKAKGGMI